VLAAGLALAGCGSAAPQTSQTTIQIGATNFVTLPVTPSTNTPITSGEVAPGTQIEGESTYIVQEGDYPSTVAQKFKVPFAEFMALNEFVLDANNQLPSWQVGMTVRIPAGATVPQVAGEPTPVTTPGSTDAPTTAAVTTEALCFAEETYTIKNGDAPALVAARFNTTINKLNQANGGTPGFAGFVVGTVIKIPVDC